MPLHDVVVELARRSRPSSAAKTMPIATASPCRQLVALDLLDGVAEGVPVVEDLAQRRLLEVLGDDLGLDRDRPLDQLAQRGAVRGSRAAAGSASTRSRITGSAMKPP